MEKPLILVTNDDGITAPGLRALVRYMSEIGEVVVVAPDSPQSGMGHAITIDNTLYSKKMTISLEDGAKEEYSCSGTPADCVKLALQELLGRKPDICVSGINHGSNSSINVIYSGTMSAAIEAGIEGIPAIGFSLCDYSWKANFGTARDFVQKIVREALKNGIPQGVVLNVNIPKLPQDRLKGIKVCRQARANWKENSINAPVRQVGTTIGSLGSSNYWTKVRTPMNGPWHTAISPWCPPSSTLRRTIVFNKSIRGTYMNKKEIVIGVAVGLIANTLGTLLYILLFSEFGITETLRVAVQQGHMGSLLALGAILNLVAFSGF